MAQKKSIRTIQVRRLPKGIFRWKVKVAGVNIRNIRHLTSNKQHFDAVKETLRGSSKGAVRFEESINYRGHELVTAILFEDKTDLMLLKLVHDDVIGSIYELKLQETVVDGTIPPREQSARRRRNKDEA